jgi:sialate O-acetylesterase
MGIPVEQRMKRNSRFLSLITILFLLNASGLFAKIELPFVISDGMVMQRREPIPIWGWSDANAKITVTFAGKKKTVRSDGNGLWHTVFKAKDAGGPYELQIKSGAESQIIRDIMVGDVWLCSGQSNMEFVLRNAENGVEDIANSTNKNIRHFKVPHTWAPSPSDKLAGGNWTAANPDTSGDFTAVGYYFAQKVFAETGIPIGLVHSSWGGANIESWMSPAALGETPEAASARMQKLTADAEMRAQAIKDKLSRWPNALNFQPDTADAYWSAATLDESDWLEISAPQLWEAQGFDGVDGIVWYRKTFQLNEKQAAGGIVLGLARIDDKDITYINGHNVGNTNLYDQIRRYTVPAEFLRSGENQIAVRVDDTGGGGGIYSDAALLYVETADGEKISLAGIWKIKADKVTLSLMGNANHTPTALYNKMIYPLFGFPTKGVLWYQGESNADSVEQANRYAEQFKNLINDWRKSWQNPDLAFYWVQLANYNSRRNTATASPWAIVREAQTAALELPNTGQAVIIDAGNPNDIHPKDKKTTGTRLSLIALNKLYGKNNVDYRGPMLDTYKIEGLTIELYFSNSATKPVVRNGGDTIMGFEVAGSDGNYQPANASIQNNIVAVSSESVTQPVSVRYAWTDNPETANLIGENGLPLGPFRITVGK